MDKSEVLVVNDIRLNHGDVGFEQVPQLLVCRAISHVTNKQFLRCLASSIIPSHASRHFHFHSPSFDISAIQCFYCFSCVLFGIHVHKAIRESLNEQLLREFKHTHSFL